MEEKDWQNFSPESDNQSSQDWQTFKPGDSSANQAPVSPTQQTITATQSAGKPFKDEDYQGYLALVKNKNTTPEQLSDFVEKAGYGKATNSKDILDYYHKYGTAPQNQYYVDGNSAPAPNGIPSVDTPTSWLPSMLEGPVERAGLALGLIDPKTYYGVGNYGENARAPNQIPSVSATPGTNFSAHNEQDTRPLYSSNDLEQKKELLRSYGSEHNWSGSQIDNAISAMEKQYNKSTESRTEAVGKGLYDLPSGVEEGLYNTALGLGGLIARGTDSLGMTSGALSSVDGAKDTLNQLGYENAQAPEGLGRSVGNFIGENAPLAPLFETKLLGLSSKVPATLAKYGDLALQGGTAGAIGSGGHDVGENALIGSVLAPIAGKVFGHGATGDISTEVTTSEAESLLLKSGIDPTKLPEGVTPEAVVKSLRDSKLLPPEVAEETEPSAEASSTPTSPIQPTADPSLHHQAEMLQDRANFEQVNSDPRGNLDGRFNARKAWDQDRQTAEENYQQSSLDHARTLSDEQLQQEIAGRGNPSSLDPYDSALREEYLRRQAYQNPAYVGPDPAAPSSPVDPAAVESKLADALRNAKDVHPDLEAAREQFHAERDAALRNIDPNLPTAERIAQQNQILSGTLDKPEYEGVRDKLSPEEQQHLLDKVMNHPDLKSFDQVNARNGLQKIFNGELPTRTELNQLSRVFSPETLDPIEQRLTQSETSHPLMKSVDRSNSLLPEEKDLHKEVVQKLLNREVPTKGEVEGLREALPGHEKRIDALYDRAKSSNRWEDKLTAYHYANMLSGYTSLARNVVGHVMGSIMNTLTHGVAGVIGTVGKSVRLLGKDAATLTDFSGRLYGYGRVLTDRSLYGDTAEAFKTNSMKDSVNTPWTKGPQISSLLTAPERLHTASYTFFGKIENAANLYQLATRQAVDEGLKGAELWKRVDEIANNPTQEMVDKAKFEANATSFRMQGDVSKMLNRALASPKAEEGLGRLGRFALQNIAPFAGIAEQKLLSTLRYIPVADFLSDPLARAQWKTIAGRQAVVSRYMLATTAMTMGWKLSENVPDWVKKYAGEIPILGMLLAAHSTVDEFHKLNNKSSSSQFKNSVNSVVHGIGALANEMQDESFLRSVGDYFVAASHGDSQASEKYWGNFLQTWLPYSAAQKELAKAVDPTPRDVRGNTWSDTVGNVIKSDTPFTSKDLPVKQPSRKDFEGFK